MSSQQGPGLIGQFFEYFFGVTWQSEEGQDHRDSNAPLCSACKNPVKRASPESQWRCPHHPKASLIEAPQRQGHDES